MSSTENNEVAVEKVDAAEEKTETKEVKGAKRPAEVSVATNHTQKKIVN